MKPPDEGRVTRVAGKTLAVRHRLEGLGAIVVAPERMTPAFLSEFMRNEIEKRGAPIKAGGVSVD
jgi:hypothetical protein